jgi:Flp pilus assembly protein TadG
VSGRDAITEGKTRDSQRGERGQALLEMAVVLPVLLILLLGVIEVGRYAELAIVVADSARTGAVYGAQNLAAAVDMIGITSAAQNDANLGPGGTSLSVNSWSGLLGSGQTPGPIQCTTTTDNGTPVTYVIVQTSYQATSLFSSTQFTLHGCAQIQVAQ